MYVLYCVSIYYEYLYVYLGVCNKKLRRYEDALDAFNKLHNILRNSAQVMYQLADLYPYLVTFLLTKLLAVAHRHTKTYRTVSEMCHS